MQPSGGGTLRSAQLSTQPIAGSIIVRDNGHLIVRLALASLMEGAKTPSPSRARSTEASRCCLTLRTASFSHLCGWLQNRSCRRARPRHEGRFWHKADMPEVSPNVRFQAGSGHPILGRACLILTQSGPRPDRNRQLRDVLPGATC
jgi:hypothetical protein